MLRHLGERELRADSTWVAWGLLTGRSRRVSAVVGGRGWRGNAHLRRRQFRAPDVFSLG